MSIWNNKLFLNLNPPFFRNLILLTYLYYPIHFKMLFIKFEWVSTHCTERNKIAKQNHSPFFLAWLHFCFLWNNLRFAFVYFLLLPFEPLWFLSKIWEPHARAIILAIQIKYVNTTAYDKYTYKQTYIEFIYIHMYLSILMRDRSVLNYFRVIGEIIEIFGACWAAKGLWNSSDITK